MNARQGEWKGGGPPRPSPPLTSISSSSMDGGDDLRERASFSRKSLDSCDFPPSRPLFHPLASFKPFSAGTFRSPAGRGWRQGKPSFRRLGLVRDRGRSNSFRYSGFQQVQIEGHRRVP